MSDQLVKHAIISDQVDQDLYVACQKIKEEGYRYIELHNVFDKSIEECNSSEIEKIQEIIKENNLEVVSIASTIFFLCPLYPHYEVSLFNPNFHAIKGSVIYHMAMLHNACRAAKALGCKLVRIFPFRYPDNTEVGVVGTKQDQEVMIEHFKRAVDIASVYDVTLVLENCPYSHCPKGEMTYQIVTEIDDPNLKLLWDPANSYRCEKHRVPKEYKHIPLIEEYNIIKKHIAHIHLKNYHYDPSQSKPFVHTGLFDGDIEYNALLAEVLKDYTGALSLEPEVDKEQTLLSMKAFKECY